MSARHDSSTFPASHFPASKSPRPTPPPVTPPVTTSVAPAAPRSSHPPPSLTNLRDSILLHLALAADHAAQRVARFAAGNSDFTSDFDARQTFALLRSIPLLLKQIPPDPPPEITDRPIPLIPICPLCLSGPGAHWVDRCPDLGPNHNLPHLQELQGKGRVR